MLATILGICAALFGESQEEQDDRLRAESERDFANQDADDGYLDVFPPYDDDYLYNDNDNDDDALYY